MRHRFRKSTLWLMLFLSSLAGIGLAYTGTSLISPVILLPFAIVLKNQSWLALIIIVLIGLCAGCWRGSEYLKTTHQYQANFDSRTVLYVRAAEDASYNKYKQLSFKANDIYLENGQKLPGSTQISGFGANAIFEGDEIIAEGKLKPGFGPYQAAMSYAQLTVTAHHPSWLSVIRRKFVAGTQNALPEPLAPFVMGLLVGQRANLPEGIKDDLLKVGLTHIIAVSGANLTIILHACQKLMGQRSKRVSTFVSVSLLLMFVILTGGSASIVRAAMVSMLSIATIYYGRGLHPLNLISLAALTTAWVNPIYLWSDLSWHLSFLAFIGVMLLAPLIQRRWVSRWKNSVIAGVALESICAEILTLPLVLFVFGQMSRVGLVANVLVVAFIPLAMLLGAIAGLAGMFVPTVAGWFVWPTALLLNYMLDIAHVLAGLPHVFIEGIGLRLWQMLLLYGCVVFLLTVLWYKSGKSAIITDITEPKNRSLVT